MPKYNGYIQYICIMGTYNIKKTLTIAYILLVGCSNNDDFPNILGLIEWLSSHKGTARLRPDQKLVFNRVWDTKRDRLAGVKYLVSELCELCLAGKSERLQEQSIIQND